eukprot:556453-Pleurochrysis_carterae.AAC.1
MEWSREDEGSLDWWESQARSGAMTLKKVAQERETMFLFGMLVREKSILSARSVLYASRYVRASHAAASVTPSIADPRMSRVTRATPTWPEPHAPAPQLQLWRESQGQVHSSLSSRCQPLPLRLSCVAASTSSSLSPRPSSATCLGRSRHSTPTSTS